MVISVIKKLLTNNYRFKTDDAEYRRVFLLNSILLFFMATVFLFAILNYLQHAYLAAAADTSAVILSLLILIYFHKTDKLKRCSYFLIAIMILAMTVTFLDSGYQHYIFAWICVFLPILFFLIGGRKAIIISALFMSVFFAFILISYKRWSPTAFNITSIINIIASALALIAVIAFFEKSMREAISAALTKNRELKEANKALAENKNHLRLILDSTAEAIFGVDMENKCTFCNACCLDILGMKNEAEIIGKDVHNLIHSKRIDGSPLPRTECNIIRTCMEGMAIHSEDEVFWRPDGTSFSVEYNSFPQYKDGEVIGAVVTFIDNTLKKMHEQKIAYYSSHDSLTGLLNRSYFESMLRNLDNKKNLPISVIMGDLNGLKLTNDIFGHVAGDELLVKTAKILKETCREEDIIARLGGDEYIILLPKTKISHAMQIIGRIHDALSKENVNALKCSMSLGCDTKIDASKSIKATIKNAENQMYKEKTLNRHKINSDMMNAVIMLLYRKNEREEEHSEAVSDWCRSIGEAIGLSETEIAKLRSAGFLHDIGKICIPDKILSKKGERTREEEIEYMQHPIIGYRIMNLFDNTLNLAEGVFSHHEQWDGKGFPRGLKGGEIPLMARIIAVADRYDNLLNNHQGHALSRSEAAAQLKKEAGIRLDPNLIDVFVNMISKTDQAR